MKQRPRIYYGEGQKVLMWERWQKGVSGTGSLSTGAPTHAREPHLLLQERKSSNLTRAVRTKRMAPQARCRHRCQTVWIRLALLHRTGRNGS
jgi:hypothetical protein